MKHLFKCTAIALAMILFVPFALVPTGAQAQQYGNVVLYEGFDTPQVPDGTPIVGIEVGEDGSETILPGFNGWNVYDGRAGENNVLQQARFTVETEPGTDNRVGSLVRPSEVTIVSTMGAFSMEKSFQPVSGIVDVSFRVNPTNQAALYLPIAIYDNSTTKGTLVCNTQIEFASSVVKFSGNNAAFFGSGSAQRGKWYEFTYRIDTVGKTFSVYEGGVFKGSYDTGNITNLFKIQIGTHRNVTAQQGCQILIDDISIVAYSDQDLCDITAEEIGNSPAFKKLVFSDISLPTEYNGTSIQWSSSNENIISSTGVVNRPSGNEPVSITLTADITKDAASATGEYTVWVCPTGEAGATIHFYEDFETLSPQAGQGINGYNGWTETNITSITPDPLPAPGMNAYTIEEDPLNSGNMAGLVDCKYPRHVGNTGTA